MSNVDAAVNAALAAAGAAPSATQAPLPAVAPQTEYAPMVPAGAPRSLADKLASAGLAADFYIQVDKNGISIDKDDSTYFDDLEVIVQLKNFKPLFAAKFKSAGGTAYLKSYDGMREAKSGKAWHQALAEAQRIDPTCSGQYEATEFVVTLAKDYTTKKGTTFPAGTKVGHTTSTTGDKPVTSFLVDAMAKFNQSMETEFRVKLGFQRKEKGQNKWGVFNPVILGN